MNAWITRVVVLVAIGASCYAEDPSTDASSPGWLVRARRQAVRDVKDVWTAWSAWSACSMPCGEGTRSRRRACVGRAADVLVRLENPTCPGDREEHFVCKNRECPAQYKSQRERQCEEKNRERVFGHMYQWKPYTGVTNPCLLTCLAVDQSFYYNFGKVTDGTECGERSVCVQGQCARIGCEGRVHSEAVLDRCRICNGQNKDCMFWKGSFDSRMPTGDRGYTHVVTIPRGATYIKVTDKSKNFIALKNANGQYIINGKFLIDAPGTFRVAGTDIHYNRTRYTETITADGPLQQDMHIMVIFRDRNNGIDYEFYLPTTQREKIVEPSPAPRYRPRTAFVPTPAPGTRPTATKDVVDRGYDNNYNNNNNNNNNNVEGGDDDYSSNKNRIETSVPERQPDKHRYDFTSIFGGTKNVDEKEDRFNEIQQEKRRYNEIQQQIYRGSQSQSRGSGNRQGYGENYLETVEALYNRSLWENRRNDLDRRQLKKPKPYRFRYTDIGAFQGVLGTPENEDTRRDPYDRPEPGMPDPYDRPEPGMSDPYDRPEPGMPDPYDRPEPGMADPYDRPEPGMPDPYDRPEPGMTDPYDRPEPGMTDRYDRPEPGMTDPYDRPEPGMTDRDSVFDPSILPDDFFQEPVEKTDQTPFGGIDRLTQRERPRQRGSRRQQPTVEECAPCPRPRSLLDTYCTHSFAVLAEVKTSQIIDGERRYEMEIFRTYRSNFDMLTREYVWQAPSPGRPETCPCPQPLTPGRRYILVGDMSSRPGRRESRLQFGAENFVVEYSVSAENRIRRAAQLTRCPGV